MAMRGFGPKISQGGHIKGGTLGSSNEISFSVLDGMKQSTQEKKAMPLTNPLGRVSLFSLPGKKNVSSTPQREQGLHLSTGEFVTGSGQSGASSGTLGSVMEGNAITSSESLNPSSKSSAPHKEKEPVSEETKAARRKAVGISSAAIVAVCVIVAIAFGVYTVVNRSYEEYLNNQSHAEILNAALASVVQADETLSLMDASLDNLLSPESLSAMDTVSNVLPNAEEYLDRAASLAERAKSGMTIEADISAADTALETVSARRTMLFEGSALIKETEKAHTAIVSLEKAWNYLLQADAELRKAVSNIAGQVTLSSSAIAAVRSESAAAKDTFTSAEHFFEAAEGQYDVDVSQFYQYISARRDAIAHLSNACDAIAGEDVAAAAGEITQYNQLDAQAVALAALFPAEVEALVHTPFQQVIQEHVEAYVTASAAAAQYDSTLRKYIASTH